MLSYLEESLNYQKNIYEIKVAHKLFHNLLKLKLSIKKS